MNHTRLFSEVFVDRKMCIFLGKSRCGHFTLQQANWIWTKTIHPICRFHYPHGKPLPSIALETTLQRLQAAFDAFPNNSVSKENFTNIMKITGLPLYWRMPLFNCTQLTPAGLVDGRRFCDFWKQYVSFIDPERRSLLDYWLIVDSNIISACRPPFSPQDVCFLSWQCVPFRIYLIAWSPIAAIHSARRSSHAGAGRRWHTSWISISERSSRIPFALRAHSYRQNILYGQSELVGENYHAWATSIGSSAGNVRGAVWINQISAIIK